MIRRHPTIVFLIVGDDTALVDSGLALFSIKEYLIGAIGEDFEDFTGPIGIILTFGEDHISKAELGVHIIVE